MLVPDSDAYEPRGAAERIPTPGAETSGFSRSESGVGPLEEKAATTSSGPPRAVVTAPTVIASGVAPGEPTEPRPNSVEVVAGRDDRHDAGAGGGAERLDDDVARRLDLGLAERHVDHVHPVRDGRLDRGDELGRVAVQADVRVGRDRQRLVVAEVRARRDAGDPDALGGVFALPAAIPATCVPCGRELRVERLRGVLPAGLAGGNARATITFAVVYAVCPWDSRAASCSRRGRRTGASGRSPRR